ncbi:DegT/DnrJ/EryC1/StrS family aminotransferase [Micromonospora sp. CA-263727]|uniref:DegT/DnrJ/EryC1/StrS family aminotransferase n=1 Tax=Micromonospora sp. CA-263727 TaxID=3239967 RepID=UPI003D9092DC
MITLFKVAMNENAGKSVSDVLQSGFIGQGPRVEEFEQALRDRLGHPHLVTVNSATSGLHLALHMAAKTRPTPADATAEVLTTPLTCTATNWPILANGLRIRWVDIDPTTLNIDIDDLARKISPRTRAIMVVHWAGYPVDLDRLADVLEEAEQRLGFRPAVIEDCAHAWGATFQGLPLGRHGNIAVYSFQAIKHLTSGDGGLVVFPDQQSADRARLLRWFGIDRTRSDSFRCAEDIPEYGFKFHMNDINAAIGLANLGDVDGHVARHRENAAYFDTHLQGVPGVTLLDRKPDRESAAWLYTLLAERRSDFIARLAARNIAASPVHQRNDVHGCVSEYGASLPMLDSVADRIVSIPCGWWVTNAEREHIVDVIREGW